MFIVSGTTEHPCSLASKGVVRNSRGNPAFGPLLTMPYSNKRNADIELELIGSDQEMGDHPLAASTGQEHNIRIIAADGYESEMGRPIVIGQVCVLGDRYTLENSREDEVRSRNRARLITLANHTVHPCSFNRVRGREPDSEAGAGCRRWRWK